jgi:peptidoglycan hydrolase-like protein with peptidoglycan-binding domain
MRAAALLMAAALAAGVSAPAQSKPAPVKKSVPKKKPRKKAAPRQTQPDPQRAREIQQALIREGFLRGEPSGKWDQATSNAYAAYQKAKGLASTGKPDAKSLRLLGLVPAYDTIN